jgi:hypothetical protein
MESEMKRATIDVLVFKRKFTLSAMTQEEFANAAFVGPRTVRRILGSEGTCLVRRRALRDFCRVFRCDESELMTEIPAVNQTEV